MKRIFVLAGLLVLPPVGYSGEPTSPIENYRKLEFPPSGENFEKGWKDRVAADYAVINDAELKSLRAALGDGDPFGVFETNRTEGGVEEDGCTVDGKQGHWQAFPLDAVGGGQRSLGERLTAGSAQRSLGTRAYQSGRPGSRS